VGVAEVGVLEPDKARLSRHLTFAAEYFAID
jgi:hypothetical protein